MNVDINELAAQFSRSLLTVDGIYHTILPGNRVYDSHTQERPTQKSGFVFAIRGSASFIFNGMPYEMVPGTVLHGGKGMELRMRSGDTGFEYYLLHYSPHDPEPGPSSEHAEYMSAHFSLEPGENPKIIEMLRLAHQTFGTPGHLNAFRVKELFYSILYELFTCSRNRINSESKGKIEQVIAYIHDHYMEPIRLSDLAERCGMNVKSFCYLFNKYAGIFPIDYLIQHRMKRAEELLTASTCTIREIAASVGYSDAHYFSRLYKKHTGQSPTQHRSALGNNPPVF